MSKRGNGEGSIEHRADGRWSARVMVDGKREIYYGRTRAEVNDKLQVALQARKNGLPVMRDRRTIAGFAAEWLAGTRNTRRWGTWRKREMHMRLHLLPTLGRVALTKLKPEQLEKLYAVKIAQGLSPLTVRHIHATMHMALAYAERRGYVARNVAHLAEPPRVEPSDMDVWTEEQTNAFLTAVESSPLLPLFVLAITTGMRKSEMLGLRWRDLDLDRGTLHLRYTLERLRGDIRFVEPKTKGSKRKLELTPYAIAELRRHRSTQKAIRVAAGPLWANLDLVFTTESGAPISESVLRRAFLKIIAAARIPIIRFHDVRHTAFTILLSRGIHPKVVSEMAGHSRIAVTMDLYSHVTPSMQRDAVAAMQAAVGGGRG